MSNILITDKIKNKENVKKNSNLLKGEIIFREMGTGRVLFTGRNSVLIAGSQTIAEKLFLLTEKVHLPTYNESLSLENSVEHSTTMNSGQKVCLFCCGTQGCGSESSQVYPVKYTGRIAPSNDLIPFRYPLKANDLTATERAKYFGRKVLETRYAYYFKAFESDPAMYLRFTDGTVIDASLYNLQNDTDAECFVEMRMQITNEDFRDYFNATTGISTAKINSISLLTAYYTESGGYKWYQDITPLTQYNMPNESLIDTTKGIDITYHLYS